MDIGRRRWAYVDAGGRRWTKVDTGRRRWTKVEAGGSRWTQVVHLKQYLYSLSRSIRMVRLYNLNDSFDLKGQILSLSYLLKIFEMSLNYFRACFSPITMISFYFRFCTLLFQIFRVISYFRFFVWGGGVNSEDLRILKS